MAPDHSIRDLLLGAAIGLAGALLTQVFQRWLQRRARRRSLIKAIHIDLMYTTHILEELAEQAKAESSLQQQRLAMLDGFTSHYQEYRRDLGIFQESVRVRLHYLFTQVHAWRDVQRVIERRIDLLKAGHGTGVPKDEIKSMLAMAAPLQKAAAHALNAVEVEYSKVFRFGQPADDDNSA